jgi:hypothetical protein
MPKWKTMYRCQHNGLKEEAGEWPECLPNSWKGLKGFPKDEARNFITKDQNQSLVFCSCGHHAYYLDSGPAKKFGFDEIGVFQTIMVFKRNRKMPKAGEEIAITEIVGEKLI